MAASHDGGRCRRRRRRSSNCIAAPFSALIALLSASAASASSFPPPPGAAAAATAGEQTYKYLRLDLSGDFGLSFADLEVYSAQGLASLLWISATNPFSTGPYWSAGATLDGDAGTCFSAAGTGPTPSSTLGAIAGSIFSHKSSPSMVNGSPVPPGSHPYLVSLHTRATGHFCAGTLIAADTVLTAASCVKGFAQSSELSLYVGRREISLLTPVEERGVVANTSTVIVHPQFNSRSLENDVAVVVLDRSVAEVQPIQLDFSEYLDWGHERWTTLGWGSSALRSQRAKNASELFMMPVNSSTCIESYGSDLKPSSMMCASALSEMTSSYCQGDTGGPLLRNSTQTQIGIMSWGYDCGSQSGSKPSVFTRLSAVRAFLQPYLGVPPLVSDPVELGVDVSTIPFVSSAAAAPGSPMLVSSLASASSIEDQSVSSASSDPEQVGYIVYELSPPQQLVGIRINNNGPCVPPGVFTDFSGALKNISVYVSNDGLTFTEALPTTGVPSGQWTQLGLFGRDSDFLLNGLPANVISSFSTVFVGTYLAWLSRNIGYEFQANTELSVVGLGYGINVNPLADPSVVGMDYTLKLWDMATESLLMTVVIPAGTELEGDSTVVKLVDSSQSVTLQSGSLYVVTVEDPGIANSEFRFAKVPLEDVASSDYDQQIFTLIRGRHSNNLGPVYPSKVSNFVMGFPIIYFDVSEMSFAEIARQNDRSNFRSVRMIENPQDQALEEAEVEDATTTIINSVTPCDCDCDCQQTSVDE